jgi:dynein heavy chain
VHHEWFIFAEAVDKMVETALRQTVKRSLQELSRAINGDGKSEIYPLFNLNVTLDAAKVELRPSLQDLVHMVSSGSKVIVFLFFLY